MEWVDHTAFIQAQTQAHKVNEPQVWKIIFLSRPLSSHLWLSSISNDKQSHWPNGDNKSQMAAPVLFEWMISLVGFLPLLSARSWVQKSIMMELSLNCWQFIWNNWVSTNRWGRRFLCVIHENEERWNERRQREIELWEMNLFNMPIYMPSARKCETTFWWGRKRDQGFFSENFQLFLFRRSPPL